MSINPDTGDFVPPIDSDWWLNGVEPIIQECNVDYAPLIIHDFVEQAYNEFIYHQEDAWGYTSLALELEVTFGDNGLEPRFMGGSLGEFLYPEGFVNTRLSPSNLRQDIVDADLHPEERVEQCWVHETFMELAAAGRVSDKYVAAVEPTNKSVKNFHRMVGIDSLKTTSLPYSYIFHFQIPSDDNTFYVEGDESEIQSIWFYDWGIYPQDPDSDIPLATVRGPWENPVWPLPPGCGDGGGTGDERPLYGYLYPRQRPRIVNTGSN